jgi:hypothetical protein
MEGLVHEVGREFEREVARDTADMMMESRFVARLALVLVLALGATSTVAMAQGRGGGPAPAASGTRFVDNGNETITDTQTGLMWEKKTTALGSGQNLQDPRDVDNRYTWDAAMGDWLDRLNGRLIANATDGAFAGHTDWRIPTLAEIQSLVDTSVPSRINPMFGSNGQVYWSSSRRLLGPGVPWYALFGAEIPVYVGQPLSFHVRAVRGGR